MQERSLRDTYKLGYNRHQEWSYTSSYSTVIVVYTSCKQLAFFPNRALTRENATLSSHATITMGANCCICCLSAMTWFPFLPFVVLVWLVFIPFYCCIYLCEDAETRERKNKLTSRKKVFWPCTVIGHMIEGESVCYAIYQYISR